MVSVGPWESPKGRDQRSSQAKQILDLLLEDSEDFALHCIILIIIPKTEPAAAWKPCGRRMQISGPFVGGSWVPSPRCFLALPGEQGGSVSTSRFSL